MGFFGLTTDERYIRIFWYLGFLGLMAFWEFFAARREQKIYRATRWPHNLGLAALNAIILRLVFPNFTLGAAWLATKLQFGLFNWVEVPPTFATLFTIVVMDWALYYQHRFLHAQPLFWKFHRLHHTDLEVDVSTAKRFHTGEVFFSMGVRSVVIIVLGAPASAALAFEILWNASALFEHANIRLLGWLESLLRILVVTPDMHRIHHSAIPAETNSNFGFIFSFWDRLFFTYVPQPKEGQEKMTLGLDVFNDKKYLPIGQLLLQPFEDKDGHFAWRNVTREK